MATVAHTPGNNDSIAAGNTCDADTADTTATRPHIEWSLSLTTEGQWNMTDRRAAWANLLCADMSVPLWHGAQAEAGIVSTWHTRGDMADVYQDFSNINADNRVLRVVHLGVQQNIGKQWTLFFGLRQADADYFATPMANMLTGGITGCYPVVGCNFDMNAYPYTALGLHVVYRPIEPLTVQASLYNGSAYDTFARSFRFRPHADGVLSFGSVCYTRPATTEGAIDATWLVGWNVGNHIDNERGRRHTQAGFWATIEQPLPTLPGGLCPAIGATYVHEFSAPLECKNYYNIMASLGNIAHTGGTLSAIFNRSFYNEAHESEVEVNFLLPLGQHFSVQPAIHYYSTCGNRLWVGQIRVVYQL